jgi:hypothetical protein
MIVGVAAQSSGRMSPTNILVGTKAMGTSAENFTIAWDVCKDTVGGAAINFVVSQQSPYGYMGINFHGPGKYAGTLGYKSGGHADRDGVYMSLTTTGGFQIWDMWAPFVGNVHGVYGTNSNFDTNLGGSDDIFCPVGAAVNGRFTASFTRRMSTGDTQYDDIIPAGPARIQLAYDPTDNIVNTFLDWNKLENLHCGDCSKDTSCCLGNPPYTLVYPECENNMTRLMRPACPAVFRRNEDVTVTFLGTAVSVASLPNCTCVLPTRAPTTMAPTEAPTALPNAADKLLIVTWVPLLLSALCL